MCNQSVGLIAGIIEQAGIATIGLSLLKMVTRKVRPPRSLHVPFPLGYPLGEPNDARLQQQVVRAALNLLQSTDELPILQDFVSG
ncbi:MAG TPA: hypothetical protein VFQ24_16370 [Terriglobia bacterium]|nr:hypothetical protein [Terriglobia bacterium]